MIPSLSIVIVNWNSGNQLRECLDSLPASVERMASSCRLENVVVVDNGSTDDSLLDLPTDIPLVVLKNDVNMGFGAACNQGARVSDSVFVLFLNPDTRLFPESLDTPLRWMLEPEHARVGIVSIQLQDERGAVSVSCARFPAPHHFAAHALGLDRFVPSLGPLLRDFDHLQTRRVDQVIGAFFLVRRELYSRLDGFDERFFVYFEELDFSLRAHALGYDSYFLAEARAFHKGGGTSDQVKAKRLFYSLRSRLQYGFKHYGAVANLGLLAVTLGLEPLTRLGALVAARRFDEAKDAAEGYRLLLDAGWQRLRRGRSS